MKSYFNFLSSIFYFLFSIFFLLFSIFFLPDVKAQQPDIQINPNFTWNGENSLGVNPANPDNLIVAWMKLTSLTKVTIAISRSFDGGNSWSDPVYMPHFSSTFTSADPTIVFSNSGTAYLAYIDYDKAAMDSGGVYVCHCADGGATWTQPVQAVSALITQDWGIDRPWLAIDNSGGMYDGNLYLVTMGAKAAPHPHHLYLVTSSDGGLTWSAQKQIDTQIPMGPNSNSMGAPAVSKSGKLSVAYLSYDPPTSLYARNVITHSIDGGVTFTSNAIDTLPLASIIPATDTLYQYSYYLAASTTIPNNLIFIYTDRRNGDWDVLSTTSFDGGMSWSPVQRINDDPIGNGIVQDMCWGGFSSAGKFAVLWRDRRCCDTSQMSNYKIYCTWSLDGGASYHSNTSLSYDQGALSVPVDGNDFLGCAVSDSMIFGTWADKRGITNQIWFNRHPIPDPSSHPNIISKTKVRFLPDLIQDDCAFINEEIIKGGDKYSIRIIDIYGKTVQKSDNKKEVCLTSVENGVYIAIFTMRETTIFQRIFLIR